MSGQQRANGKGKNPSEAEHDYLRAFYRVVTAVNSSLQLNTVLNLVAEKVAEAVNVKACSLRLLDPVTGTLTISATSGLSQHYLQKGPVKLEKSQLDQEVLQERSAYIRNAARDPRFQYPEQARIEGIVSVFCVPLVSKGQVLGVLRVYSGAEREFTSFEEEFLHALASVSALAIENARLYEALKQDFDQTLWALWGEPPGAAAPNQQPGMTS